jgi:hypothetical protein
MHPFPFRTTFFRRSSLALLAVALLGCAVAARRAVKSAPVTRTATAAVTTPPRRLRLAQQAVPIEKFRDDDHDVDLRNVLSFGGGRGDVYFGQCDRIGAGDRTLSTIPLIVAMQKGAWVALSLEDPRLKDAEWQFVASGPADGEIWGVLDDSLDQRGKTVLLAHSLDTGATWSVTAINKPFGAGDYDSFRMDHAGHGRLSVYLAVTDRHPERAGFYHFHTPDGGRTWTTPEHEPDALDPADDVPEDQDPEPLKSAPAQTAMLRPGTHLR